MSTPFVSSPLEFPEKISQSLEKALLKIRGSLSKPKSLASDTLELSDLYIKNDKGALSITPWEQPKVQKSYMSYYFPLNWLRIYSVLQEAQSTGFLSAINPNHIIDFGAGPGVGVSTFEQFYSSLEDESPLKHYDCVETSKQPQRLFESMELKTGFAVHWHLGIDGILEKIQSQTLGLFSYSLNELTNPPKWLTHFDHLMILEPATQNNGRKLSELRQYLIDNGYSIWAPCLHQQECPLLLHSKKDWCHNRLHWKQPTWFQKIEVHMPIKNNTLTYSYLLASKISAPSHKNQFRLTGDLLKEKGKTRIMACRNSEREFLSWLKKDFPQKNKDRSTELKRGQLIKIENFEAKGNELRVKP